MPNLRARVARLERERGIREPYFNLIDCQGRCVDCEYQNMTDEEWRERTGP
jgi:hypothetical protein